ncbi:MAG: hypothetical protein IT306_28070 [Chloroflexi bacterium]|nr:hypothetical protein [Chloroflexota bacterium]
MQQDPAQPVSAPAIGLLVAGGLSLAGTVVWLIVLLSASTLIFVSEDSKDALFGVGLWVVLALLRVVLDGVTIYGGLQMRSLRNWNWSMAGAVAACIPCTFCCVVSLPLGVWALVVLLKDETKALFADQR